LLAGPFIAAIFLVEEIGIAIVIVLSRPFGRGAANPTRRRRSRAAKAVARGDAGHADYLKRFYDIDSELPTHYDIVIDTDRLDPEAAAELIVSAARSQPDYGTR
jgi:cytidylate kinase